MFDNKQIEQFRQIKAPDTLRTSVLGTKTVRRTAPMVRYAALAASLLFVLTVTILFLPNGNELTAVMNGDVITASGLEIPDNPTAQAAAYSLARTSPTSAALCVPLTFETDSECRITVSSGELTADGESVNPGDSFTADGELNVNWIIDTPNPDSVYTFVLHTNDEKIVLVMKYDNGWNIRLNEN